MSPKFGYIPLTMIAGCGAMAIAEVDNLHQLWGILLIAGLGIGGIVVPASIITTIICPDVSASHFLHAPDPRLID
jgi:hypothetical protein